MSKYMQIDIRLLPHYGAGGLKAVIPNIFKLLHEHRYDLVIERSPSLYEMVEVMIRLENDPHIPESSKGPLRRAIGELKAVRDKAREALLARRLNEMDDLLYRLEDLFIRLDENMD